MTMSSTGTEVLLNHGDDVMQLFDLPNFVGRVADLFTQLGSFVNGQIAEKYRRYSIMSRTYSRSGLHGSSGHTIYGSRRDA